MISCVLSSLRQTGRVEMKAEVGLYGLHEEAGRAHRRPARVKVSEFVGSCCWFEAMLLKPIWGQEGGVLSRLWCVHVAVVFTLAVCCRKYVKAEIVCVKETLLEEFFGFGFYFALFMLLV